MNGISVASSGSLGRMEQLRRSDADLIVLLDDAICPDCKQARDMVGTIWNSLKPLRLTKPRPTGIYATPTSRRQLCDADTLGKIDEDPSIFGKRMQLLLDSQPVIGDNAFHQLQAAIVSRYSIDETERNNRVTWRFLINDLIRYFRSLSVHYQWASRDDSARWRLRNVKLRFSRLLLYSGLLFLLAESSTHQSDPVAWLVSRLRLTPLERIAWVYSVNDDGNFWQIATAYDEYLRRMDDPEIRNQLESAERGSNGSSPSLNQTYQAMMDHALVLSRELQRFIDSRRGVWADWFFDSLFF